MDREVRYCTTDDGVRIAYSVTGTGPPLLVIPTPFESFALAHSIPSYNSLFTRMCEGYARIDYDLRGVGLSQRDVAELTVDGWVRDIHAVLVGAKQKRVAIWGYGDGAIRALAFAATYPGMVRSLVLYGGYVRAADVVDQDALNSLIELAKGSFPMAARLVAGSFDSHDPDYAADTNQWVDAQLSSIDADYFIKLLSVWKELDATPYIPLVHVPALVLHRRGSPLVPISHGQKLAAMLPNARFLPLDGDLADPSYGDSQAVVDAVRPFLAETSGQPKVGAKRTTQTSASPVVTVLFTDLVGHTEMMQRLGDAKGRDVLREHERITRETLKQHDGTEVKTMGDGFLASFSSVTSAVECAIALQRAISTLQLPTSTLQIRVGLNAGEPIEEDGDLFGATVILASRIAAKAGAGEILVPDTVRGLLSGKGFVFGDRGEFVPKGFDEGVRLWDVRWRE